jgi:hypothetical protein
MRKLLRERNDALRKIAEDRLCLIASSSFNLLTTAWNVCSSKNQSKPAEKQVFVSQPRLVRNVLNREAAEAKSMTSTPSKQTPLEMLVVAQLAAIRKREATLESHLHSNTPIEAPQLAAEVWQLQNSADRLSRMIDAMGLGASAVSFAV